MNLQPKLPMIGRMLKFPLPFHLIASLVFFLLTLVIGSTIGLLAHYHQHQLLLVATQDLFERSLREITAELRATYLPVQAQINLLAQGSLLARGNLTATDTPDELITQTWLTALAKTLETNPSLSSIHWRSTQGASLSLRPLTHANARRRAGAPPGAVYRFDLVSNAGRWVRYYDERLLSMTSKLPIPDLSPHEESASILIRQAMPGQQSMVDAYLSLKHLSATLSRSRATPSAQLAILNTEQQLLASSHGSWTASPAAPTPTSMGLPLIDAVLQQATQHQMMTLEFENQRWEALVDRSEIIPDFPIITVMAAPHDEVLAGANALLQRTLMITAAALLLALPLTWAFSRRLSQSLRTLAATAGEIRAFRFPQTHRRSWVKEVDELALTLQHLCATLQRFLDISARLAAERHYQQLLEEIVAETMMAANAGGGVVYLLDESQHLTPMAWRRDIAHPQSAAIPHTLEGNTTFLQPLFAELATPTTQTLRPAALPADVDWLGAWFPGQTVDTLFVPLINRNGERLGLLLLARTHDEAGYERESIDFVAALSGTLAITIEKQQLLAGRQALLDGIIRMIAGAIDARSPYTSAHCQRVPVIVALLADAAANHPDSPFQAQAKSQSANTQEALHLAAWLHDCGKLFVPDYITDKSVKLEAIHNRIHEIRTRIEVLKRDAEIVCWREIAAGGDAAVLRARMQSHWAELDEDFAFIARCNQGDPPLTDADLVRLKHIGKRIWLRTLDDRLGISAEELQRKAHVPPRPLPTHEHLLADRLEHLIGDYLPPAMGITATGKTTLRPPRHRLNLGELYCLSVRTGTLTAEERYLINAHILGTISMLSTLPFPTELACVPEIAGSHHEHLDGSGYPFGRQAAELSLAARIIAIADVFEALTATDRPYKAGKSAAEALDIMADMAKRQHLDADLLALFIKADIPSQLHKTVTKPSPSPA